MRFCYCKDRILGVRLTRRVVKLVLLNEKYEKDSKIGAMDTGAEKIIAGTTEAEVHLSLKLADFDAEHSTSISQLYTAKNDRSFESIMIYASADKTGWGYPPEESGGGT